MRLENIFDFIREYDLPSTFKCSQMIDDIQGGFEIENELFLKVKSYLDYEESMEEENPNLIPWGVIYALRQRKRLNKYDSTMDIKLLNTSPNKIMSEYLEWNGLMGWWDHIKSNINLIYEIDLDEIKQNK